MVRVFGIKLLDSLNTHIWFGCDFKLNLAVPSRVLVKFVTLNAITKKEKIECQLIGSSHSSVLYTGPPRAGSGPGEESFRALYKAEYPLKVLED